MLADEGCRRITAPGRAKEEVMTRQVEKKDEVTLLVRGLPGDVARELDARAERNYRSRSGEVLAILTEVCRGHVALPVSMDGATLGIGEAVPVGSAGVPADARD